MPILKRIPSVCHRPLLKSRLVLAELQMNVSAGELGRVSIRASAEEEETSLKKQLYLKSSDVFFSC